MIYFVQYGSAPYVKIGYTGQDDLLKRISSLQTATPEPLNILAVVEGTTTEEAAFHVRFAEHEVLEDREWFWIRGDLKDFLAEATPYEGPQLSDCVRRTRARRDATPADLQKYIRSRLPEIESTLHEIARDQNASESFRCEVSRMLTHIACVKHTERIRAAQRWWRFYELGKEDERLHARNEGLVDELTKRIASLSPAEQQDIAVMVSRAFEGYVSVEASPDRSPRH